MIKKNGNIISNCRISKLYEKVDYVIADIPNDKEVIRIENRQPIFDNPKEVKELKKELDKIKEKENEIKQKLSEIEKVRLIVTHNYIYA